MLDGLLFSCLEDLLGFMEFLVLNIQKISNCFYFFIFYFFYGSVFFVGFLAWPSQKEYFIYKSYKMELCFLLYIKSNKSFHAYLQTVQLYTQLDIPKFWIHLVYLLRAFASATSILFYFIISISYFINYTILFYNITNIPTFIFLFYSLK